MKKLIFLFSIVLISCININAQEVDVSFDDDTVKADTNTYYFPGIVPKYSGIVIFQFKHADVADSLAIAKLQGSMDGTNYIDLSGTGSSLSATTTDGTDILYDAPPLFLYYRAFLSAATGDTISIEDAGWTQKEE